MVAVNEFNAMNPTDRQAAIQNLMQGTPEDRSTAQMLMIQEREAAGLNTANPTVMNPQQAAMIRENQSYNAQVYKQSQPIRQPVSSNIVNAPIVEPSVQRLTPLQALVTVAANNPEKVAEAKSAFYPVGKEVTDITYTKTSEGGLFTAQYVERVEPVDSFGSLSPELILAKAPSKGFFSDWFSGMGKLVTAKGFAPYLPGLPSGLKATSGLTPGELRSVRDVGLVTVSVIAPLAAPVVGVSALGVVGSEALGVGLSQGFKAVQGGGLLTPSEAIESAAVGGVLTVGGAGILKGAGSFGKALNVGLPRTEAGLLTTGGKALAVGGRVGVNTALGAGGGYVLSGGDVESAKQGAVFGLGFGLLGEAAGAYVPKIQTRLKTSGSGVKAQERINRFYEADVFTGERAVTLGLKERLQMKVYGIGPQKPSVQILEQAAIPTAPKEAFDIAKITEFKTVGGKSRLVESTRLTEKVTPESTRLIPKMQANLEVSDILTLKSSTGKEVFSPNTVLTGKSVEPSQYYAETPKKTDVQNVDFEKLGLTSEEILGLKSEAAKTRDPLSFSKAGEPQKEFSVYSFRESSKASVPVSKGEFGFSKRGLNFKEIQANIKSGRMKGADVSGEVEVNTAGFYEKPVNPYAAENAISALKQSQIVQAGKGKTFTVQDRGIVAELTKGQAAQPTGIEKVLGDFQSGRAANVSKEPMNPFTTQITNPFVSRKIQREEEETQFLVMPGEVKPLGGRVGAVFGIGGETKTGGLLDLSSGVASLSKVGTVPTVDSVLTPSTVTMPIEVTFSIQDQPFSPAVEQPIRTDVTQTIAFPSVSKSVLGFPAGSKSMEGGFDIVSPLKFVGVGSRKKVYPISTGMEVLGFGGKPKRVKKSRKR